MALSGTFYNYPVSQFGLYCEWQGTQSISGNYTDITLKVYLRFVTIGVAARTDGKVSINGTESTYSTAAMHDYSSTVWHNVLLTTKTVRVNHETDGTKNNVALSASWRFSGTYSGVKVETITASTNINLNAIDRTAPNISLIAQSITADGCTLTATASENCNTWQYSTDNGSSWTTFSTASALSATATISGLSAGTTYQMRIRAAKVSNSMTGTSSAVSVSTIGGTTIISIADTEIDRTSPTLSLVWQVYDSTYTQIAIIYHGSSVIGTVGSGVSPIGQNTKVYTISNTLKSNMLSAMTNTTSESFTLVVETRDTSGNIVGTSSKGFTAYTTATNSAPAFTGFTIADSNSKTVAVTEDSSLYIQSASIPKFVCNAATAKSGASIVSYQGIIGSSTCGGTTATTFTLDDGIQASGNLSAKVIVTDSRGYTASAQVTITVIPYTDISVTSWSLRRVNDAEAMAQLALTGTYSPITINGSAKNTIQTAQYRYKLTTATDWGTLADIGNITQSGGNFVRDLADLIEFNADDSFDVEITIADRLSRITLPLVLGAGTPLMAYRKAMVGINKSNPSSALDVNGNIQMNGYNVLGYVGQIPSDTTLNDYKTPGIYYAEGGTSANKYPVENKAGTLVVVPALYNGSNMVYQFYLPLYAVQIYFRHYIMGSMWQAWTAFPYTPASYTWQGTSGVQSKTIRLSKYEQSVENAVVTVKGYYQYASITLATWHATFPVIPAPEKSGYTYDENIYVPITNSGQTGNVIITPTLDTENNKLTLSVSKSSTLSGSVYMSAIYVDLRD